MVLSINPLGSVNHSGAAAVGPRSSAETRFENDQLKAKRQSLTPAAQAAVPLKATPARVSTAPVRSVPTQGNSIMNINSNTILPSSPAVNQSVVPQQQFSLEDVQADAAFEYFLSSPELQTAVSTAKLRQYFKRDNPAGAEATLARGVMQSLISHVP